MADFKLALPFILKHEGDKLFIDKASGERSKYGITVRTLISIKYGILDPDKLCASDVENIYYAQYWNPNKLTEINSQLVANKIFDMCVNMGSSGAIKMLQASLNSIGGLCVIDGIIGPHTVIVVNQFLAHATDSEERLLSELVLKATAYYVSIAKGDKAKYLKGWLARAEDIGTGTIDKVAFSTLRDGGKDKVIKG